MAIYYWELTYLANLPKLTMSDEVKDSKNSSIDELQVYPKIRIFLLIHLIYFVERNGHISVKCFRSCSMPRISWKRKGKLSYYRRTCLFKKDKICYKNYQLIKEENVYAAFKTAIETVDNLKGIERSAEQQHETLNMLQKQLEDTRQRVLSLESIVQNIDADISHNLDEVTIFFNYHMVFIFSY
jgi:hypothetical protein